MPNSPSDPHAATPSPATEAKLSVGTEKPKRAVVTLYGTPPVDPTYSTVLFRVKLADESYFEVDLSSVDAQKLGSALNAAGGGVLNG